MNLAGAHPHPQRILPRALPTAALVATRSAGTVACQPAAALLKHSHKHVTQMQMNHSTLCARWWAKAPSHLRLPASHLAAECGPH